MSKADKMRGRLASIQKDREDFERQKKELEADMSVGRHNMSKINKGLRNNVILEEPIVVDTQHKPHNHGHGHHNSKPSGSHNGRDTHHNGASANGAPLTPKHGHSESTLGSQNLSNSNTTHALGTGAGAMGVTGSGNPTNQLNIMPSGPRVSDWCYSAPLDSHAPPQVKTRELYENVRLLGRGSFGEVNLVKNVEDNKLFAIKTQLCPKDSEYHNVLREVRFLRTCRHPCIIDVHDAFLINNPRIVYIVMHYCESGTISSVISSARKNKSTLAESQVVKWVLQLALAMQYLHDNQVVHRDLKPMNVMLTEGGDSLKLADFGLAMSMAEKAEEDNTDEAGTPYYTAPEMIQREPYSYPADCWSFGVIVHQLLALERPFDGASTGDLVKSILSGEIPALPVHYSDDIKLISRELLRKDQTERLTMTEILLEPMFYSKLASFPQSYRPRTLEERIRRSHQKQLECQMESLNRVRRAEGYRSLHDRVAQRQQAEEATTLSATTTTALAASLMTDTITTSTSAADISGSGVGSGGKEGGGNVSSNEGSPAKSSTVSRSGSTFNTTTNTRDSTPNTTANPTTSNTNNATNNTNTHHTNTNTGSNSTTNLRRHTETPTMLSDEVNNNSYIRASRSNVEDVLHPAENLAVSPDRRNSNTSSSGTTSPIADTKHSIYTNAANNTSGNSINKLESVAEYASNSNSTRIDTSTAATITDGVGSVTSTSGIVPSVLYSDSMDSVKSVRANTTNTNTTADTNHTEPNNTDPNTTNNTTNTTSAKTTPTKPTTTNTTNTNTSNTSNTNSKKNIHTIDTTDNTDTTTDTSRPTTPHGGRKGQELQRAIENDHFYALSEQDVSLSSGVADITIGDTDTIGIVDGDGTGGGSSGTSGVVAPDSPNTRTHSFESKFALEQVHDSSV